MAGVEEYQEKLREIGSEIRAQRESLGLSIGEVSDRTKIRSKYLLAVEAGDESPAPGTTYFKAFLKTYATFLGLDGLAYSQAYQRAVEERDAPPMRVKPRPSSQSEAPPAEHEPVPEVPVSRPNAPVRRDLPAHRPAARRPRKSGRPFMWAFILLFIVAIGAYVAVTWEAEPAVTPEPPVSTTPPPSESPPVVTPPPEPPAPKIVRTDPNKEATVFTVDRTPVELVIRTAEGKDSFCWVRVSVDGELAFEKTLSPGQEQKITGKSEIKVRAGKPWVISLIVNGQDQGNAGEFGPVKDITVRAAQ
ncbi:MAG: RodZ domain-containing protein [Bacillota bacterium]